MAIQDIWRELVVGLLATTWLEFVAVAFGILSVLYSRAENILVYPTGLVNTTLYIYLSMAAGLYAEASVNAYYTLMSIIGWAMWSKKEAGSPLLRISHSDGKAWRQAFLFFGAWWLGLWWILARFTDSQVPLADAFAAAAAYTGMWLMTKKKLENWLWWILTNLASIPLYFSKGLVFTSFQYLVFLILACLGWLEWRKKLRIEAPVS